MHHIKHESDGFIIIMVWVDDLYLFASLDGIMRKMKSFLLSRWEITDLGEPNKMIGRTS